MQLFDTSLAQLSEHEASHREMVMEAILSIQSGDNPRVLAEKLQSYVAPAQRGTGESAAPVAEAA